MRLPALVLLVLACASAEASSLSIESQVLGPDGKGLAGARVELRPVLRVYDQGIRELEGKGEPEPAARAVTEADGWFRFPVSSEGPWRVSVTVAGYPTLYSERMVIGEETIAPAWIASGAESSAWQWLHVSAPPLTEVPRPWLLEVYDGSRPVRDALVRDRQSLFVVGRTGADGSILLSSPTPGSWALRIETRDGRIALYDAKPISAVSKPEARIRRRFLLPPIVALTGRVVDRDTGKPIAGGRVWSEADPAAFVVTDASGSYRLPWTLGTPVVLEARAEGHFGTGQSLLPAEPRWVPPTLPLWPVRMLEGVVVRPDGEPVPAAEVRVFERNRVQELGRARASAQGRFRVPVLRYDSYDVLAAAPSLAPGLAPAFEIVTVVAGTAGTSGIRLVMRLGRTARGRIVDEHGVPVAEARVELTRSPASLVDSESDDIHQVETGAEGRFELAGLPAGWYDLAVSHAGFVSGNEPALEVPEASSAIDLGTVVIRRGATVTGWVTGPDREPLAGAEVRSMMYGSGQEDTVTGPDGRFAVGGVDPSGEVLLLVCRSDRGSEIVRLPELPEKPIEVVLKPAARLSGRVVGPDGEAVAGASVKARIDTNEGYIRIACPLPDRAEGQTDSEGRFDFFPLGSGTFYLSALKKDFIGPSRTAVELQPGEETEAPPLVLERGSTIVGRVVTADGSPAPGTIVSVPAPDDSFFLPHIADGDGRYRIEGVPAGQQRVQAQHTTLGSASREVTIADGENRVDLTLDLQERHFAHGWVVDPDGEPVASALVRDNDGGAAYSAGDGSFSVEVALDQFALTASKTGYTPARLNHWATKGTTEGLELRLGRGASLTGRILGVEPGDMAQVKVTAAGEVDSIKALVSSEGVYRFLGLEPGPWWVQAYLGNRSKSMQVDIAPGDGEVVADLWLPERYEVSGRVLGPGREPVEGVKVALYSDAEDEAVLTGKDGTFSLAVFDGTYDVVVYTDDSAAVHGRVTVSGAPVEDLEIRLTGRAVLSGHIFGIPEDELLKITIRVAPGYQMAGDVNADGSYLVEDLGPGTWRVTAFFGVERVTRQVTVHPGQTSAQVDLPFTLGDLTLSVRLTGYREIADGVATLIGGDDDASGRLVEGVEGNAFAFSRLNPGRYFLTVRDSSGTTIAEQEVELTSSQELMIDLGKD